MLISMWFERYNDNLWAHENQKNAELESTLV